MENNKATAVPEDAVPLGFMGQFADLKKDPQPPGKHILIRWINHYTIMSIIRTWQLPAYCVRNKYILFGLNFFNGIYTS